MSKCIWITGASGLLGRSILSVFQETYPNYKIIGLGFSRAEECGLIKCDLRNPTSIEAVINEFKPDLIIHSAAERKPDACESDPEGSALLNVISVFTLASYTFQQTIFSMVLQLHMMKMQRRIL